MARWRRVHEAEALGAAIATLRHAQGLTQEELSEWLGVDRSTVVRLEAGDAAQLRRLMDALSVLGADLVVVERSARVTVTDAATVTDGRTAAERRTATEETDTPGPLRTS